MVEHNNKHYNYYLLIVFRAMDERRKALQFTLLIEPYGLMLLLWLVTARYT